MFDEYAHLIVSGMDDDEELVSRLHSEIASSMDFRTTVYNADTYPAFSARMVGKKERSPLIHHSGLLSLPLPPSDRRGWIFIITAEE